MPPGTLRLGAQEFTDAELVVMAVVNRTPDSFCDKGSSYRLEDAISAVDSAVRNGAQIVDIGGVKAAPGPEIPPAEEIRRVAGLVTEVRARHPGLVISVDTWRAEVAEAAVVAGADVINDAWGGFDPGIAEVAAKHGAGLVCTHAGGLTPRTVARGLHYPDLIGDIRSTLDRLTERAVRLGVARESILVDPGHDFNKNTMHSLEVTRRLGELTAGDWPVLVAVSNKDFIGESLDLPVAERLEGTLATLAVCAWLGARVFRVHNVREARRALDMVAVIRGSRPPRIARRATT
ncbi:MAG: dihydropteroate synthase [Pseudonocardiaceae bacterium]